MSLILLKTLRRTRCARSTPRGAAVLAFGLFLSACGGGNDGAESAAIDRPAITAASAAGVGKLPTSAAAVVDNPPAGTLQSVTRLGQVLPQEVMQVLAGSGIPLPAPAYAVETFRLTYTTLDGQGRPIVASGLLAVPQKAAGAASPVISYQHATIFHDAEAPSNHATADEPAVVLASLGFIVVAADYVGYGVSKGQPHPYLLAAPTASAVIDLLRAGRTHAERAGLAVNGQLFLLGYSEGGYATLAAHRALQQAGGDLAAAVVGSAPGAGPLNVGATLDELLRRARDENPLLAALVTPELLQDLSPALRRWVRDELLKRVLPEDADVVFQTTFIDNFLANDRVAIGRDSDVFDWRPNAAVRLFHGRDDLTVPYVASLSALQAMQARGAPDVSLADCHVVPSSHLSCVLPYWAHLVEQMGPVVRGL